MIVISRVRRSGRVDFVIVLAEENIERIRRYDPVMVSYQQLPAEYSLRRPESISVTYATAAELVEIERMSAVDPDWKNNALKMLSRGFEFRADLGDHDFGPVVLGKPPEGTKQ